MLNFSINRRRTLGWMLALAGSALLLSTAAWAASELDAARDTGVVGERRNGYIGLVVKNPTDEQKALVKRINAGRRAQYKKVAKKTGATVEEVAALTAERLMREAKSGHYVQAADDGWVRKP
ncbi:MAG: YdbL family protein [bacterium]|nr:YdbL family protein [bacterium]